MAKSAMGVAVRDVLRDVPDGLRDPLVATFSEILRNYWEGRWEPSELNGGKLSEIVFSILRGYVEGEWPAQPKKPANFVDACRGLEASPTTFPRSVRVHIPRMLMALYEVRSNRGVAHVGGDVDPNHMDATVVVHMAKWTMAELVRIFHNVDTDTATSIVEALIERDLPIIWKVNGVTRVLDPELSYKQKTLVVLHAASSPTHDSALQTAVEHPRMPDFRKDVLVPLHRRKLVEYDRVTGVVHLSPLGVREVEQHMSLRLSDSKSSGGSR